MGHSNAASGFSKLALWSVKYALSIPWCQYKHPAAEISKKKISLWLLSTKIRYRLWLLKCEGTRGMNEKAKLSDLTSVPLYLLLPTREGCLARWRRLRAFQDKTTHNEMGIHWQSKKTLRSTTGDQESGTVETQKTLKDALQGKKGHRERWRCVYLKSEYLSRAAAKLLMVKQRPPSTQGLTQRPIS